jgi:hypothetical protein
MVTAVTRLRTNRPQEKSYRDPGHDFEVGSQRQSPEVDPTSTDSEIQS